MSEKIMLIGAGQLGSRHLQGVAKIDRPLEVFVVDPSELSLSVALERFNAVKTRDDIKVVALRAITEAPNEVDVAIIATTANVRLAALEQLIRHTRVGKLLLEKVLFQDLAHYDVAKALLGGLCANTWVNCAQRLWPFFNDLRREFFDDPNLEIIVTGSNWGLGCNSVHNTDIADYLWTGGRTHKASLNPDVIESKRAGFKEFTGELVTMVAGGGSVRQISYNSGNAPFMFNVYHPRIRMCWDVSQSRLCTSSEKNGWAWEVSDLAAPFQSQLTASIVTNMLDGVDCGLPSFDGSAKTHVATLTALIDAARRNGLEFGSTCPIT